MVRDGYELVGAAKGGGTGAGARVRTTNRSSNKKKQFSLTNFLIFEH